MDVATRARRLRGARDRHPQPGSGSTARRLLRTRAMAVRGSAWSQVPGSADTYPEWLAGGPDGVIAAGSDADGGPAVWRSTDGRYIRARQRRPGRPISAVVDPHADGDGYVALGSPSAPPMLLRSTDGEAWAATADRRRPRRRRAPPGRRALGLRRPGHRGCGLRRHGVLPRPDASAWWSGDGTGWGRLPRDGTPIGNGGSVIVPAGDHGLLAIDGATAWSSPDGWAWRPLPTPSDGSLALSDAVVDADVIVAVGIGLRRRRDEPGRDRRREPADRELIRDRAPRRRRQSAAASIARTLSSRR